jgi:hypothetical protein
MNGDDCKCFYCGVPLMASETHFDHLIPERWGGRGDGENVVISCSLCNSYPYFREREFTELLANLLSHSPEYSDVKKDVSFGAETRYRADLLATRTRNGCQEKLLVECKASPATFEVNDARKRLLGVS